KETKQIMSSDDSSSSSDEELKKKKVKKSKKDTKSKKTKKDKKKKKKVKKDPNAPRRHLSAFIYFSKEMRPTIKAENPQATFGELGSLLGKAWDAQLPENKKQFEKLAAEDKKRWEMEKKIYDEKKANAASDSDSSSDSD
ncbi:hypothetical protein SAMD00019534_044370, partial [Acytostelium subglobosum LB1]|uniref:hypothetical protein n=1 Tax=Acytostelium subglobosum LB1 TaxID=1410327 RepID=UPI000644BF77